MGIFSQYSILFVPLLTLFLHFRGNPVRFVFDMKKLPFLFLFCLLIVLHAEEIDEPAYIDEKMGLAFPAIFAGLPYQGFQDYSEHGEGLGYSLRYRGKGPQKLDIYVYDKTIKDLPEGVDAQVIRRESANLISDIQYVVKRGDYSHLKIISRDERIEAGDILFLRNRVEYVQNTKPAFEGTLGSQSLITGWGGAFVKIRFTYALSAREEGEKIAAALPETLAAVLNAGGSKVREDLRKTVLKAIHAFRNDPHAEENPGVILLYAVNSEAVEIGLGEKVIPWLTGTNEPTEADRILLAAFIAGNIEAQLQKQHPGDQPYPGALQVIQTYRQLQKDDEIPPIPAVENWIRLESEGKLKTYFGGAVKEPE